MIAAASLDVRQLSRVLKALGDETRLRMVALLSHGELCVCHLEQALKLSQPTASRHLAVLRAAGVVESRRAGTWVYYRVAAQIDTLCRSQLRALVRAFGREELLRRDVMRLARSKGPGACQ